MYGSQRDMKMVIRGWYTNRLAVYSCGVPRSFVYPNFRKSVSNTLLAEAKEAGVFRPTDWKGDWRDGERCPSETGRGEHQTLGEAGGGMCLTERWRKQGCPRHRLVLTSDFLYSSIDRHNGCRISCDDELLVYDL